MREIKFRVWSNDQNKMVYPDNRGWFHDCFMGDNLYLQTCSLGIAIDKNGKEVEVQQYTGLKDKNGKEIYEGDIVNGENRFFKGDVKQNVHFLNGCFMFGNWNAHEFFNKHQFIEVIGNIYENPELLK